MKFGRMALKKDVLTRSPSLLCFVTSSRVSFWSCLVAMKSSGTWRGIKLGFIPAEDIVVTFSCDFPGSEQTPEYNSISYTVTGSR